MLPKATFSGERTRRLLILGADPDKPLITVEEDWQQKVDDFLIASLYANTPEIVKEALAHCVDLSSLQKSSREQIVEAVLYNLEHSNGERNLRRI